MHFKTFYRTVLLLPMVVWLLYLFLGSGGPASILPFLPWPVAAEYTFLTACSVIYMGRLDSVEQVRKFVWRLPLLFTAVTLFFLYFYPCGIQCSHLSLSSYLELTIPFSVFVVFIGYAYCLIADLVFAALKKCGLIALGSCFSS